MNTETSKFFVYGTLKEGQGNHFYLRGCRKIGEAVTESRYKVYGHGFPLAVLDEQGHPLRGEIYEVDDPDVVDNLDMLEGNGSFYTRSVREFQDINGEKHEAWIYEIPAEYIRGDAPYQPDDRGEVSWRR